ncbi:MAG: hypothetical protein WKG01_34570 [Kofleriaceae bacterium]
MRSIVIVAALSAGVLAAPRPRPPPTWSDWVGNYEGKLVWRGCSAPGGRSATIALTATDGAMAIDLAPAGLRMVSLVAEDTGWSAQQGDLMVTLARPGEHAVTLAVDLSSGCTLRAKLRRKSTQVATCDRLIGWARVEAACSKLADGPTEDLSKLVATRWRAGDRASCGTRADRLERALVDAGCAPHPDPLVGVRAPGCLALQARAGKLDRCASVPPNVKAVIVQAAGALGAAAQSAEPAEVPTVERQCRDLNAELVAVGARFRCANM